MVYIGIDPGKHTGIAVWDSREGRFLSLETMPIHRAMDVVRQYADNATIVFEDARQRKWYSGDTYAKLQGAGSIKRDCTIWEDFCTDLGIPCIPVPPAKGLTKMTEAHFKMLTKWKGRTSNHARDAAMLVMGR